MHEHGGHVFFRVPRDEQNPLRTGAIAIIDALGFKGIWRRHRPDVLLARLREMASLAREEFDQLSVHAKDPDNALKWTTIAFLSDTVVIAAQLKSTDECPPLGHSIRPPNVDVLFHRHNPFSSLVRMMRRARILSLAEGSGDLVGPLPATGNRGRVAADLQTTSVHETPAQRARRRVGTRAAKAAAVTVFKPQKSPVSTLYFAR